MADKGLSSRVAGLASQAVSNPVGKAARAVGVARGVTGAAYGALRGRAAGATQQDASDTGTDSPQDDASLSTVEPAGGAPAEDTPDSARSDDDETTGETTDDAAGPASADTGADTGADSGGSAPAVDLLPYPHLEEPVPIVEDVLAAEEEHGPPVGGHATEPHASTRDEAHGDAQLQRAEQEEIAEEVAEAMPGGDLDLETPVGTTGADVGYNPDTAEADLQQPGTAPGIEPGLTSTVAKDQARGLAASDGPDEVR